MARNNKALSTEKKAQLLQLLAEDETYQSVAEKVGCSLITVKRYAASHKEEISRLGETYREAHFNKGFANKYYRVSKLARVAQILEEQMEGNDYLAEEIKIAGSGATVRYKVRDEASIRQYRGVLDDIAKELGDRKNVNELTGKDGTPVQVQVELDDVSRLSADERVNRFASLLDRARARGGAPDTQS